MNGQPTHKEEIEFTKVSNGLQYWLNGELTIMYTHDGDEEIERVVMNPWMYVIHLETNEILWDRPCTEPQYKFFKDKVENYMVV